MQYAFTGVASREVYNEAGRKGRIRRSGGTDRHWGERLTAPAPATARSAAVSLIISCWWIWANPVPLRNILSHRIWSRLPKRRSDKRWSIRARK